MQDNVILPDDMECISQENIECNPAFFASWLCDLVQNMNTMSKLYTRMYDELIDLRQLYLCLEARVKVNEENIQNIFDQLAYINQVINALTDGSGDVNTAITILGDRISWIYNRLPMPYGIIDSTYPDWKIAMGNLNVLFSNDNGATYPYGLWVNNPSDDGAMQNNVIRFKVD